MAAMLRLAHIFCAGLQHKITTNIFLFNSVANLAYDVFFFNLEAYLYVNVVNEFSVT